MSFIKLPVEYQYHADMAYKAENEAVDFIDSLEQIFGKQRWFSIGRTHIEEGYMALCKGITESYKAKNK